MGCLLDEVVWEGLSEEVIHNFLQWGSFDLRCMFVFVLFTCFETGYHYVAQADLEFMILLLSLWSAKIIDTWHDVLSVLLFVLSVFVVLANTLLLTYILALK
jgi:hypothetical protein